MPIAPTPAAPQKSPQQDQQPQSPTRLILLSISGFLLALLQSICGAAVAINSFRLAIGIGSLVFTSGAGLAMSQFHHSWLRRPMIALGLISALLNLALLIHVRYLRNRPASRWRQRPLTPRQLRSERLQLALSIATLILVAIEEYLHLLFHHHL